MTRKLILATAALLTMGALTVGAQAQPPQPPPPGGGGPGAGRPGGRGPRMNPMDAYKTAFKAIKPTPEQQIKFDALDKAMAKDGTALRDLEPEERMTKMRDMMTKYNDDVEAILTPEQLPLFKTELEKARQANRPSPGQMFAALKLTDDQKKKVDPIVKDMSDQMQKLRQDDSMDRQERMQKMMQIVNDAKAKIRPLLTPEQQKQLDTMQFGRGGRRGPGGPGGPPGAPPPGGGAGA